MKVIPKIYMVINKIKSLFRRSEPIIIKWRETK